MTTSDERRKLIESAEQAIRPSASGWSSAGGVPDSEPRIAHSPGHTSPIPPPSTDLSTSEFLRLHDLERALLALERRTAGRDMNRTERRLAEHYRRQLGN